MKYVKTVLVFIFFASTALGQKNENLLVSVAKEETSKDSCCIYDMSIRNRSDSTLCVLHSIFIRLTFANPQGLALYRKSKKEENYSFHYSFQDTAYDLESSPYWGELVLPYQTLNFKIRILPSDNDKVRHLGFEYLYLSDFSYRKFMEEMKQVGSWYYKYHRMGKSINVPN